MGCNDFACKIVVGPEIIQVKSLMPLAILPVKLLVPLAFFHWVFFFKLARAIDVFTFKIASATGVFMHYSISLNKMKSAPIHLNKFQNYPNETKKFIDLCVYYIASSQNKPYLKLSSKSLLIDCLCNGCDVIVLLPTSELYCFNTFIHYKFDLFGNLLCYI